MVWETRLKIAVLDGPRISSSEGRQCVENTGFEGEIAFSPHVLGTPEGTRIVWSIVPSIIFDVKLF